MEDLTKKVLLSVADGPESIEIYTSEDEVVVDWGDNLPSLYLTATVLGASIKLGPFCLPSIRNGIIQMLKQP